MNLSTRTKNQQYGQRSTDGGSLSLSLSLSFPPSLCLSFLTLSPSLSVCLSPPHSVSVSFSLGLSFSPFLCLSPPHSLCYCLSSLSLTLSLSVSLSSFLTLSFSAVRGFTDATGGSDTANHSPLGKVTHLAPLLIGYRSPACY